MKRQWSPAVCCDTWRQSNQAAAACSSGRPCAFREYATWLNLSGALDANRLDTGTWASVSTFTTKRTARRNTGRLDEPSRSDHRISGGSSDKALNEFAVSPKNSPSAESVVTTVTPVANCPSAARRSRAGLPATPPAATVAGSGNIFIGRHDSGPGARQRLLYAWPLLPPTAAHP